MLTKEQIDSLDKIAMDIQKKYEDVAKLYQQELRAHAYYKTVDALDDLLEAMQKVIDRIDDAVAYTLREKENRI